METDIDEKCKEDNKPIKKKIGNVNFGLLEKGGATAHQSILFKSIDEAIHYQTEYGGKIHKVSHIVSEEDDDEKEGDVKASYYILNLKDTAELTNGYRYIKLLLLQHHNFKMNQYFYTLILNGIYVYSVKPDAFVLDTCNVEKAKELLEFHNYIGGWKVSKQDEEINLPTEKYEVAKNESIQIPVDDEYSTDKHIEIIEQNDPILIRGELPGTGKSYIYICQEMVDKT